MSFVDKQYDIWTSVPFDAINKADWTHIENQSNKLASSNNKSIFNTSTSSHESFKYDNNILQSSVKPPKQASFQPLASPLLEDHSLAELIKDLKSSSISKPKFASLTPLDTSTTPSARYVRVGNLPGSLQATQLVSYFNETAGFNGIRGIWTDQVSVYSHIVIAFYDTRDAQKAAETLRYERGFGTALDTECITREQLMMLSSSCYKIMSESEGEVQIEVLALSTSAAPSAAVFESALRTVIKSDVKHDVANFSIVQADHSRLRARCIFFDDRIALQAVLCLQGLDIMGCRFSVSSSALPSYRPRPQESALFAHADDLSKFVNPFTLHASPMPTPAPIHPTLSKRSPMTSPPRGRHAVPRDNMIDLEAIKLGLDNRTTVMLKNLPSHMDVDRLYRIVNEVTPRAFDFIYVRIDFDTGSSVGYAFVNFLTPQDIIRFARARLNTRWDPAVSDKQVYMSYANFQGKETLVERFRNSDVMCQKLNYRPRVFYSNGPNVGLPQPFPAPDMWNIGTNRLSKSAPMLGSPFLPGNSDMFFSSSMGRLH